MFVFVTINSFLGLPVVRYLFKLFKGKGQTVIIQNTIQGMSNYFEDSSIQHTIISFKSLNELNKQNFKDKLLKYYYTGKLIRKYVKSNVDICFYTYDFFSLWLSLFYKKKYPKKGIRVIYHQFELFDEKDAGKVENFFFRKAKPLLENLDLMIFPEKNRMEYFSNLYNIRPSIRRIVFPNTNDNKIRIIHRSQNSNKLRIGHVGAVGVGHHIKPFLNAAYQLPTHKYEVVFVGKLSTEVKELIESYRMKNLRIIDQIPHDELHQVYQQIDIGLILYADRGLNYRYCAPNKLYEYWSYGIPVLAHDLPGLQSVFNDEIQGALLDLESSKSIIEAIYSLTSRLNIESKNKLATYFQERYHLDIFISDLDEVIESVLNA